VVDRVASERLPWDSALRVALLNQSDLGVALCGTDGVLAELNPVLESMLGAPYMPSRAETWSRCYHLCDVDGEPLAPAGDPLARAARGEHVVDEVISARPPGADLRYLRCNATHLRHADGTMAGAVVFVTDATREISQRRELDALRERLVETVNHELRTPIAVVKGHVELLQDTHDDLTPAGQWSVRGIVTGLARLEAVLDSIQDLAERSTR
jgi:signal transduction histidine kinase